MFTTSRLLVYGGLAISLCLIVTQAALPDVSCMNKYRINDYGIRSGHRLSVICNGSSVNIIITQEESGMDDYIALDYYCYHLNGSALESDNLFRTLYPGNHNYNYPNIVPTNSRCVFVGCVEKYGIGTQWYYMKGNGSSCTNEVPETSSSIPTSSTASISTSSTASIPTSSTASIPTSSTASISTSSTASISTSSKASISTSSTVSISTSSTASISTSSTASISTSSTASISTSSTASISTSSTASIPIPSPMLIISCFLVIVCTRKAFSTNKNHGNLIIEIEDSKEFVLWILPSEHLEDSHSLRTICADLNFKKTSNIDYKENTTNTQETSCGNHTTTTTTTTTTTEEVPHTNEITVSIEYSEGSGEVEGSCPALYDTSIITVAAQAYTYSSDYVVEESITVHSLMNSNYITVAEMDIATCPSLN